MTSTDHSLKDTLDRLGLRQTELARLLDVSPRTVSQWATGDTSLPGTVAAYLRVLQMLPPEKRAAEFSRLKGRNKMLDEGIYSLNYAGPDIAEAANDGALAVLRAGKVLGSDRWGGVFTGSYEFDTVSEANRLHVRLQVPPDGELITGFAAGPEGATLDIIGAFERAAPISKTTVEVAGHPLEVLLIYLGPLPN